MEKRMLYLLVMPAARDQSDWSWFVAYLQGAQIWTEELQLPGGNWQNTDLSNSATSPKIGAEGKNFLTKRTNHAWDKMS